MKTFDQVIQEVKEDQTSGSSHVVETLIAGLISQFSLFTEQQKLDAITKIELLYQQKPFFAVLEHLIGRLKKSFDSDSLINYLEEIDKIQNRISNQFIEKIKPGSKTFLLHSQSETIIFAFENLAKSGTKHTIFQTLSEPHREGIIQAKRMKKLGLIVDIVEDDVNKSIIDRLDYFVTGADLIYPDSIINKSGTLKIAEQVDKKGKPYIVLADYRKFISKKIKDLPNSFEVIPRSLITELITGQ